MVARKILKIRQVDALLAPGAAALRFSTARQIDLGPEGLIEAGNDITDRARAWPHDVLRTNVKRGDVVVVDVPLPIAPRVRDSDVVVAQARHDRLKGDRMKEATRAQQRRELRAVLKKRGVTVPWNATLEAMQTLDKASAEAVSRERANLERAPGPGVVATIHPTSAVLEGFEDERDDVVPADGQEPVA